jgi:hypothetical protein
MEISRKGLLDWFRHFEIAPVSPSNTICPTLPAFFLPGFAFMSLV